MGSGYRLREVHRGQTVRRLLIVAHCNSLYHKKWRNIRNGFWHRVSLESTSEATTGEINFLLLSDHYQLCPLAHPRR